MSLVKIPIVDSLPSLPSSTAECRNKIGGVVKADVLSHLQCLCPEFASGIALRVPDGWLEIILITTVYNDIRSNIDVDNHCDKDMEFVHMNDDRRWCIMVIGL